MLVLVGLANLRLFLPRRTLGETDMKKRMQKPFKNSFSLRTQSCVNGLECQFTSFPYVCIAFSTYEPESTKKSIHNSNPCILGVAKLERVVVDVNQAICKESKICTTGIPLEVGSRLAYAMLLRL